MLCPSMAGWAGAMSTGTHGTGQRLGGIASAVVALRLVKADGSVVVASAKENRSVNIEMHTHHRCRDLFSNDLFVVQSPNQSLKMT